MTGDNHAAMTVAIERLGGIRAEEFTFQPGVTVLTGRNATNRTSLLRSLAAGLGGSAGELKSDADDGSVTLSFDGGSYTRRFERDGRSVHVDGDPYTDDDTLVDQYATLLADNPARRAVRRGDGDALREFIMAPVDTAAITASVESARRDIESLEERLSAAERKRERIPALEQRLAARREERDETEAELNRLRDAVSDVEAAADTEDSETIVERLQTVRTDLEEVRNQREIQANALDSLREEREETATELQGLSAPSNNAEQLEAELERLQRTERELMNTVNNLLSIVEFNEQLTAEDDLPAVVEGERVSPTDQLSPETETVECWTCGTGVERGQIDAQLESLRDVVQEKRRERNEVQTTVEEIRSDLDSVREARDRRASLETRLDDIDAEITQRETRIEDLDTRAADLREQVESLESEAAASEDLRDSDVIESYQRLSELEYERGQVEEQIDSLEAELDAVRETASAVEDLRDRLEERRADLSAARNRIESLEREAVETFNDHMATILDLLEYENVERVWIERKVVDDEGATSAFALHVVRATEDDVVYEDTVDHLSESEREVIGFVVALAGYLVHDVHETVPAMLLDSLEAIDSDRIAALVEYFADFVPFLIVALLPEDASALSDAYARLPMGQAPA